MPLFSNKFSPKTIPVRRQDTSVLKNELGSDYASKELSIDVGPLKLKLGDFEICFEDGQWIPGDAMSRKLFHSIKYHFHLVDTIVKDNLTLDPLLSYSNCQYALASGRAGAAHKEVIKLKKELERLEEENNMLRLKFEILLDMMTDKTVEAEQQAEMQRAQSLGSLKVRKKKEKW